MPRKIERIVIKVRREISTIKRIKKILCKYLLIKSFHIEVEKPLKEFLVDRASESCR